ncbi:hypothetical protein F4813DRAFT_341279 [Daldinia decipiens]|uniref:uncharacterized protein n=1 Tax=Daldinia decipiens TaxID=326647 RepID=UPI0020C54C88|nr:uncharacterized protein F4813DRAFT_341279 [Daldinia decipiens]KAI1662623.1 hypothetical protein F4813DRAFT_341279 [Daldinia decipiens]
MNSVYVVASIHVFQHSLFLLLYGFGACSDCIKNLGVRDYIAIYLLYMYTTAYPF